MCTSPLTPVSTSSNDDSKADNHASPEVIVLPVDEWRTQYLLAFTVMRRFFYNSTEHHDLKSLPKGTINAQVKKAALYKQWSDKNEVEKVKIAELATKSYQLSEREKKAVNARYLLQKKRPIRRGQVDLDHTFFNACFGLFTYHADKWVFDRPSWMSKSVSEVSELCKSDIEMRRA